MVDFIHQEPSQQSSLNLEDAPIGSLIAEDRMRDRLFESTLVSCDDALAPSLSRVLKNWLLGSRSGSAGSLGDVAVRV